MQWSEFIGAESQKNWFQRAIETNRLASTFLLIGPEGIGKRRFARLMAKTMFCPNSAPELMNPCGTCEQCVQIEADTHPDLLTVCKPDDRAVLPLELLVGERENRMREGLLHDISLKPFYGERRIAIIDDADTLAVEGANSLLKTLEEPPPKAIIFLIGTSTQKQLPTIRSRCQVVNFQPLTNGQLAELLMRRYPDAPRLGIEEAVAIADGRPVDIDYLLDEELANARYQLLESFSQRPVPIIKLVQTISGSLEAVGKDTALRRVRMKKMLGYVIDLHRCLQRPETQLPPSSPIANLVASSRRQLTQPMSSSNRIVERTLDAIYQIDRMITPAAVTESWAADVAMFSV